MCRPPTLVLSLSRGRRSSSSRGPWEARERPQLGTPPSPTTLFPRQRRPIRPSTRASTWGCSVQTAPPRRRRPSSQVCFHGISYTRVWNTNAVRISFVLINGRVIFDYWRLEEFLVYWNFLTVNEKCFFYLYIISMVWIFLLLVGHAFVGL